MQNVDFDFQKDVLDASQDQPVVVDFWAEWCAPCRILGPVLEKLAEEANGNWRLVKLNTEEQPQLAAQFGIRSIPAVKMFYNGEVISEFIGALPEVQVRRWLQENIPTPSKKILAEARKELSAGNNDKARELLQRAITEDEGNYEARVLLAELIFESDSQRAENLVQNVPEENPLYKNAEAILILTHLLNNYEALAQRAKESDNAADAWEMYLKGIQALRQQNYEAAIKNWIEVLTINRKIDDDGPRRACVALFTWLGQEHELTQKYHRAFTSALF